MSELRPPTNQRHVIEDFKPCSQSHLWKLMMSFYDRKGVDSWSQGIVPHFITCNTFIGKAYAKVRPVNTQTIISELCELIFRLKSMYDRSYKDS